MRRRGGGGGVFDTGEGVLAETGGRKRPFLESKTSWGERLKRALFLVHTLNSSKREKGHFIISSLAAETDHFRVSSDVYGQLAKATKMGRFCAFSLESLWSLLVKYLQICSLTDCPLFLQVVDSGVDEASCFFVDHSGEPVKHGYLFEGIRWTANGSLTEALSSSLQFDMSRRKVRGLGGLGKLGGLRGLRGSQEHHQFKRRVTHT